jgi:membrane-associated protein
LAKTVAQISFLCAMDMIKFAIDFFLHLDKHLASILTQYGTQTYGILFLIIFVETGLIVMPLLPGDSLLFAAGALAAATGKLDIAIVIPLLITAALLGDNVNYFVGHFFGEQIKKRNRILFFKREYLDQTHAYYEKHGGKTVIMARFIPIIRTIAPFVAGAGSMKYPRYIIFCILGAILWVTGVTLVGYEFGNMEIVKKNFEVVILGIIFVSILPIIWQFIKSRTQPKQV